MNSHDRAPNDLGCGFACEVRPKISSPRMSTAVTWFLSTLSRKSEKAISWVPARVVVIQFHSTTTVTMITTNSRAFLTF